MILSQTAPKHQERVNQCNFSSGERSGLKAASDGCNFTENDLIKELDVLIGIKVDQAKPDLLHLFYKIHMLKDVNVYFGRRIQHKGGKVSVVHCIVL